MKPRTQSSSSSTTSKFFLRLAFIFVLIVASLIVFLHFHSISIHQINNDDHRQKQFNNNNNKRKNSNNDDEPNVAPLFSTATPDEGVQNNNNNNEEDSSPHQLIWNSKIYLPIPKESITAFKKYQDRQKNRLSLNLWSPVKKDSENEKTCLSFTPECRFFREIETPILFDKCCAEHRKLKKALTYTIRAFESWNDEQESDSTRVKLFLDSGSLLSFARDGGDTLVPWETDIDLGVVGAWPERIDEVFKTFQSKQFRGYLDEEEEEAEENQENKKQRQQKQQHLPRHHFFESCKRKQSANKSRDGTCSDAFYVYSAKTKGDAMEDTSRVEIWPFREDGEALVHPTRKKLTVRRDVVLPLQDCQVELLRNRQKRDVYFWGIKKRTSILKKNPKFLKKHQVLFCPFQTEGYLDNEYGRTWRWPKTIHWGQNNAPSWNGQ